MPGIFGRMLGGLFSRFPEEARPQTRYDFDRFGYITPSDGRVPGDAEVKEINAYNEKVAKEIAERDKLMNEVVKKTTPLHASVENWKREVPGFFQSTTKDECAVLDRAGFAFSKPITGLACNRNSA